MRITTQNIEDFKKDPLHVTAYQVLYLCADLEEAKAIIDECARDTEKLIEKIKELERVIGYDESY